MNSRARNIELDGDVIETASQRAASEGLSTGAFISDFLRRSFERSPSEESIIVHDHSDGEDFTLAREPGESDAEYESRASHFGGIFNRP